MVCNRLTYSRLSCVLTYCTKCIITIFYDTYAAKFYKYGKLADFIIIVTTVRLWMILGLQLQYYIKQLDWISTYTKLISEFYTTEKNFQVKLRWLSSEQVLLITLLLGVGPIMAISIVTFCPNTATSFIRWIEHWRLVSVCTYWETIRIWCTVRIQAVIRTRSYSSCNNCI